MSSKLKINIQDWLLYAILIPFLYPRGFSEYSQTYKSFFTLWLYGAIVCIFLLFVFEISTYRVSMKVYNGWTMLYFILMCSMTLFVQHSFNEGLQKMFAAPALCVFCAMCLKRKPRAFISCVSNLLTVFFLLNLTVFNPLLWKQYFEPNINHLTFLGHVQINAQLGIAAIFFAFLDYYLYIGNKKRLQFQIALSVITMLTSFTSAAYIAVFFLLAFYALNKLKNKKNFVSKIQVYVCVYFFLNFFLFWFITYKNVSLSVAGFSLNGRGHIWKEALDSFFNSPVYGYGVHGVLIKVFWSAWVGDGQGMNYMHNQILQVLNDGGIILLIPYIFMIFSMTRSVDKIEKNQLQYWSVVCLMIMLFIMTFESVMEYFYVFFIFTAAAYLPEICHNFNGIERRRKNG